MEDFYHAEVEPRYTVDNDFLENIDSKSDPTIFIKVASILLVRAGLFLSQVSSIPSSNIQILIFQNIIDIAINTVVYSLIGFVFAYGKDFGAFIGIDGWLADNSNKDEFVEGWLIIIGVSGLLIAAIGDRISFFASLLMNTLVSGIVFPVFIHWIMTDSGWMRSQSLAKVDVSYKDYSYSGLIHMAGGFLAFITMLILNKRLLRFKDMDVCSIPDNGPSLTLFGNLFMIIGFFGVAIPTEKYILTHLNFNFYGIVITNLLLSAFGAVTATLLLTFSCPCEPMHKWTSMRSIQAGISGIAVIAGGADVYYPMVSLGIGVCNGFLFFLVSFLVNVSPIEDYSNIIACHFVSGLMGTFLPPIFGIREGFDTIAYFSFIHFTWQIICDMVILSILIAIFTPLTFCLDYCSVLRSWDEDINHRRALFASKSIKNENGVTPVWRGQEQAVSYVESDYKTKEKTPPLENQEPQEKVDILFEKKSSPTEPSEEVTEQITNEDFIKVTDSTREFYLNEKPKFNNDRHIVSYMVQSKPMVFFEEINSDSRQSSCSIVKDCGDSTTRNSKLFDIKLIKGIKNISDSKLLQKFKDNWTIPKKRTTWNRSRDIQFGSLSNIWVPSAVRLSLETQV